MGYAPRGGDFTPPPFVRQGQDKPRRAQASGACLDSQRPPVRFVTKGGIPSKPACAGFPVVDNARVSRNVRRLSSVRSGVHICAQNGLKNASHRETYSYVLDFNMKFVITH